MTKNEFIFIIILFAFLAIEIESVKRKEIDEDRVKSGHKSKGKIPRNKEEAMKMADQIVADLMRSNKKDEGNIGAKEGSSNSGLFANLPSGGMPSNVGDPGTKIHDETHREIRRKVPMHSKEEAMKIADQIVAGLRRSKNMKEGNIGSGDSSSNSGPTFANLHFPHEGMSLNAGGIFISGTANLLSGGISNVGDPPETMAHKPAAKIRDNIHRAAMFNSFYKNHNQNHLLPQLPSPFHQHPHINSYQSHFKPPSIPSTQSFISPIQQQFPHFQQSIQQIGPNLQNGRQIFILAKYYRELI